MQSLLPCWTLAAFIISIPSVSSQEVCYNQWSIGPAEASYRNCDILSGSTDLISRCAVTRGNIHVTLEWHFSSSAEEAGKSGNILGNGMDQHFSVNMICLLRICAAELTIYNVSISDVGYYWCKVAEPAVGIEGTVRNPSSVLKINELCEERYPCTESPIDTRSLNNLGCAYGDVTVNNTKIVQLQSESGCEDGGDLIVTSNGVEKTTTAITSDSPTATITSDTQTTTVIPDGSQTTEPSNTQHPSGGPTDMTTSDQILLTTEDIRQTGPPAEGNTTPDITSSGITPAVFTVGGASGDSGDTSDATSEMDNGTRPLLHVMWPVAGVGISALLIIIAVLLGMIVRLQCIKRKPKDNNVACVNQVFMVEEVQLVHIRSVEPMIEQDKSRNHLCDSNFTLTTSSNKHSPSQLPVAQNASANRILCPGQYEDVDLECMNQNNAASRKHYDETMANDDYDDYNRLLHSESWPHNQSLSTSLSRTSGSPLLNNTDKDSEIFDNPNYRFNPIKKHISIYRSESSDSNFNSGQTRLARTPPKSCAKIHKEHFQDSSQFSSYDHFEDDSKQPVSPTGIPPASHYTHVLPNASEESTYAYPIKSTGEQYVSEHGHIYLMLEGATAPDGGEKTNAPPPPTYSEVMPKRERANNKLFQIEKAVALHDSVTIYCSPPDTEDSSVSDYDVIGREQSVIRHTSTSDDSGYDVIERGEIRLPAKSVGVEAHNNVTGYDVIERGEMGSVKSVGVEAHYNVTDRQRASREHLFSPQDRYRDYDVIETTTTPSNSRTHKMTILSKPSRVPAYSTLELSGDRDVKSTISANVPLYDVLNPEKFTDKQQEACQYKKTEAFYHTVHPEEQNIFAIP